MLNRANPLHLIPNLELLAYACSAAESARMHTPPACIVADAVLLHVHCVPPVLMLSNI
jgi:hypothetical protein